MADNQQIFRSHTHDYKSPCIYMLTVTVEGRRPLLGRLAGDVQTAHIELTPLGEDVRHELYALCDRYPQLRLLQYQIMPDHVHVILQATTWLPKPLGNLFSSWKIACGRAYGRLTAGITAGASALARDKAERAMEDEGATAGKGRTTGAGALTQDKAERAMEDDGATARDNAEETTTGEGATAGASALKRDKAAGAMEGEGAFAGDLSGAEALAPQENPFRRLFAEGYNDRILQGKGQLQRMIDYIRDNPRRLLLKHSNSSFFTIHRNITIADHTFDAIGNLALLQAPLMAVHCRRHWSPTELQTYTDRCAEASRQGTVLIGAFISKAEKAIALHASENQRPLIHLMDNGFPELYKPTGNAFYTCAEGRLLQLAPWGHHTTRTTVSREQCNALNTIAETIASTL